MSLGERGTRAFFEAQKNERHHNILGIATRKLLYLVVVATGGLEPPT